MNLPAIGDLVGLLPNPHSIVGTWIIVLVVILSVIAGALALRWLAPIRPTPYPASDEVTMILPKIPSTGKA